MTKTIKIIDLLNLVYEKKAPKKILYKYCEYEFYKRNNDYQNNDGLNLFEYLFQYEEQVLNLEVEIIDDNKKIDKLEIVLSSSTCYCLRDEKGNLCSLNKHTRVIANKLNETINKVNYLLEKSDKDE